MLLDTPIGLATYMKQNFVGQAILGLDVVTTQACHLEAGVRWYLTGDYPPDSERPPCPLACRVASHRTLHMSILYNTVLACICMWVKLVKQTAF